jgi:hypothetical protein
MGRVLRDRITLPSVASPMRGFIEGFMSGSVSPKMALLALYRRF